MSISMVVANNTNMAHINLMHASMPFLRSGFQSGKTPNPFSQEHGLVRFAKAF